MACGVRPGGCAAAALGGRHVPAVVEVVAQSAYRHSAQADGAQRQREGVDVHHGRNTQSEGCPLWPLEPHPATAGSGAMTPPLRILGIPGSLRRASYNHAALRAAQALAPEVGAQITIFTL